jgi:ribose 5-phosphate isomerase B
VEVAMIALGSDHGGFELKEEIKNFLNTKNIEYKDYGTFNTERTDYPIYAEKVARAIQSKECESGILICKSGAGMTITANKFKGIRAGLGFCEEVARASKADDNINVLILPSEYISKEQALKSVEAWVTTSFKGQRYNDRLLMIENIEKNEMK